MLGYILEILLIWSVSSNRTINHVICYDMLWTMHYNFSYATIDLSHIPILLQMMFYYLIDMNIIYTKWPDHVMVIYEIYIYEAIVWCVN